MIKKNNIIFPLIQQSNKKKVTLKFCKKNINFDISFLNFLWLHKIINGYRNDAKLNFITIFLKHSKWRSAMLRSMPFILISIIAIIMLFGNFIPIEIKKIFYAISLSIKTIIIFILPFVIFSLLFKSVVNLTSGATYIIGIILLSYGGSIFEPFCRKGI